jgi:hypothetical protein
VQPDELLKFATDLIDPPEAPEAALRGAARASYYAVYHLVCDHFGLDPKSDYGSARHQVVRDRLQTLNPSTAPQHIREAKRVFNRLLLLRVRADYYLDQPFSSEDAEDAVSYAEAVFSRAGRGVAHSRQRVGDAAGEAQTTLPQPHLAGKEPPTTNR